MYKQRWKALHKAMKLNLRASNNSDAPVSSSSSSSSSSKDDSETSSAAQMAPDRTPSLLAKLCMF